MSDKELLELAAKAAGIKILQQGGVGYWQIEVNERGLKGWNPLIDDGDALRLAVKLRIEVVFMLGGLEVGASVKDDVFGALESTAIDKYAATRRAIVRAAAEIGRAGE